MTREVVNGDLKQLFNKFISETISKQIETECQGIFPLTNVYIRKCKVLKKPKFDAFKLAEMHTAEAAEDAGVAVQEVAAIPETDF